MNQGRCFLYEEGDAEGRNILTGGSGSKSGSLNSSFNKGLTEACEIFKAFTLEKDRKETASLDLLNKTGWPKSTKPPPYIKLKTNKPYGECQIATMDPEDLTLCTCDINEPCGESSECINRALYFECPPTCKTEKSCQNQRFQRRSYPKLKVKRTSQRGWGLELGENVSSGTFIIEYVGELITMAEVHNRMEKSRKNKEPPNYYYMTLDGNRMIDAGPKGNLARFMNHSCDPNCFTEKWTVNGDTRIGLFAVDDISKGTELTFNYQLEVLGDVKQKCFCKARNCSGFIGEKPTTFSPDCMSSADDNFDFTIPKALKDVNHSKVKKNKEGKKGRPKKKDAALAGSDDLKESQVASSIQ